MIFCVCMCVCARVCVVWWWRRGYSAVKREIFNMMVGLMVFGSVLMPLSSTIYRSGGGGTMTDGSSVKLGPICAHGGFTATKRTC